MNNRGKNILLLFLLIQVFTFSSFAGGTNMITDHPPVTRTIERNKDGLEVKKTIVLFNKNTSREDVIAACSSLSKEKVQLTFEKLIIRKGLLGLLGNSRIAYAKGKLQLPNGLTESFEAGGLLNFRYIRLTYTQASNTGEYTLNLIETVD